MLKNIKLNRLVVKAAGEEPAGTSEVKVDIPLEYIINLKINGTDIDTEGETYEIDTSENEINITYTSLGELTPDFIRAHIVVKYTDNSTETLATNFTLKAACFDINVNRTFDLNSSKILSEIYITNIHEGSEGSCPVW